MPAPTITELGSDNQVKKFVWNLTNADGTGGAIPGRFAEFADRTVYMLGTWGGATVVWEGGDGTTYLTLTDAQTVAISKTADAIETVVEVPEYSRPRLSGGAGSTVTVTCIARRGFKRT